MIWVGDRSLMSLMSAWSIIQQLLQVDFCLVTLSFKQIEVEHNKLHGILT